MVGVAEPLQDDFIITTAGCLPEPVDKTTWLAEASHRMTLDRFTLRLVASRRFGDTAAARTGRSASFPAPVTGFRHSGH
jgi:hypothetical protein